MHPMQVCMLCFFLILSLTILFCRKGQGCAKQDKVLTDQHSMLHRHAVALHLVHLHPHPLIEIVDFDIIIVSLLKVV